MGRKFIEQVFTLFTAAVGLMAALAWNDAVQALINEFFPHKEGLPGRFIFAILITLIAVILTGLFSDFIDEIENPDREDDSEKK